MVTPAKLPEFLRKMLLSPPKQGAGLHPWIFRCVRQLKNHRPDSEILRIMQLASQNCGRDTSREIMEALHNAKSSDEPIVRGPSISADGVAISWPAPNPQLIASIQPLDADFLQANMPTARPDTETAVSTLFPGNPLLCVATAPHSARTEFREFWRGKFQFMPLMVPSPMISKTGVNLSGRVSPRCLNNTGPRKYAVCEFDHADFGLQQAIIWRLREILPPVMVVHSGGKSLHAWFHTEFLPPDDLVRFLSAAALLGADTSTFVKCQLVRIPGGRRDCTTRQPILYFDPNAIVNSAANTILATSHPAEQLVAGDPSVCSQSGCGSPPPVP